MGLIIKILLHFYHKKGELVQVQLMLTERKLCDETVSQDEFMLIKIFYLVNVQQEGILVNENFSVFHVRAFYGTHNSIFKDLEVELEIFPIGEGCPITEQHLLSALQHA